MKKTPLHELIEKAREKNYAIDFSIYGGRTLDEYMGGSRLTGTLENDPMDIIAAGVKALDEMPVNHDYPVGNS
jgi:hypothetical protein